MPTEEDALRAGEEYVAATYPAFNPQGLKPFVRLVGNHWEFSYTLPDDMLGGSPVVEMDKTTLSIIRSYRAQ